jgi:hypothetical protein
MLSCPVCSVFTYGIKCAGRKLVLGQVWWLTPVIPALGRLRQEGSEFEASLSYIARSCLRTKQRGTLS